MTQKKEWIVMHCLNAFRDVHGNPGEHKIPLEDFDMPMTKDEALEALHRIEADRPNEDFSIRCIADVLRFPHK